MISQELITQVLTLVVQLAVILTAGWIISYLRIKIGIEKWNQYHTFAKTVVHAVEQIFGEGNGPDKKQEALQALRVLSKGKLSEERLERLIEAAVYEMNKEIKTI